MLDLHGTDFDQQSAHGIFVVDFSAEWCPPCRALKPVFERAAAGMAAEATFAAVDADRNGQLLARFGIQALPTIVVLRDGQPVHSIRGLRDEKSLVAEIRKAIEREPVSHSDRDAALVNLSGKTQ
jgi:thioredoxin